MTDAARHAARILRDALDLDATERTNFIAEHCAGDPRLRGQVEALLLRAEASSEDDEGPIRETDAFVGQRLGAFRLGERIGRGGMGVVYRGTREGADFSQEVAIKLIRRGFDFDDVHARFRRERRILARLDHPNLARFIDGGVAPDGRPWFALEYVDGTAITRWCDAHRMPVRRRVHLFLEVCAAVQYAHEHLVVHRDLKPANILVDGAGRVRLLDFGIARLLDDDGETLAATGIRSLFTPEYAAPEQFGGESAHVATDVYALGVILYELLVGALPYPINRHDLAIAEDIVRRQPPQSPTQAIARDGAERSPRGCLRGTRRCKVGAAPYAATSLASSTRRSRRSPNAAMRACRLSPTTCRAGSKARPYAYPATGCATDSASSSHETGFPSRSVQLQSSLPWRAWRPRSGRRIAPAPLPKWRRHKPRAPWPHATSLPRCWSRPRPRAVARRRPRCAKCLIELARASATSSARSLNCEPRCPR
jgi:serine/threonine protein kinase